MIHFIGLGPKLEVLVTEVKEKTVVKGISSFYINPLGLAWWCWLGTLECAPPQGLRFGSP